MKLNRFTVVMTAYSSSREEYSNERCMNLLIEQLCGENRRFQFDHAKGMYKGEAEPALAVQCNDFTDVGMLLQWARDYKQESILIVDARGKAFLLYCNNSYMEYLGKLYSHDLKEFGEPSIMPDSYTVMNGIMYYTV